MEPCSYNKPRFGGPVPYRYLLNMFYIDIDQKSITIQSFTVLWPRPSLRVGESGPGTRMVLVAVD